MASLTRSSILYGREDYIYVEGITEKGVSVIRVYKGDIHGVLKLDRTFVAEPYGKKEIQ